MPEAYAEWLEEKRTSFATKGYFCCEMDEWVRKDSSEGPFRDQSRKRFGVPLVMRANLPPGRATWGHLRGISVDRIAMKDLLLLFADFGNHFHVGRDRGTLQLLS